MACSRVNISSNFASSSPLMSKSYFFLYFITPFLWILHFPLLSLVSFSTGIYSYVTHLYLFLSPLFFMVLFPSLYNLSLSNSCIIASLSLLCLSELPLSWLRALSLFLLWVLSIGQHSGALKMSSERRQEFKVFVRISYSDVMTA
jgi:hypothetical protein